MKLTNIGLLPRVLVAIVAGIGIGAIAPEWLERLAITVNGLFGQLLGFIVPLIIVAFVADAIASIGRSVGKILLVTVALAFGDTILAATLGYGVGEWLFPSYMSSINLASVTDSTDALAPYFTISIPPIFGVMSALVLSFILGLCISRLNLTTLSSVVSELRQAVESVIKRVVIPLLPVYVFGIFVDMTYTGKVLEIMQVFATIIVVIFVLHLGILLYEYVAAGLVSGRNPLRALRTMLPAYFTALGTSSSAATIPVTLRQVQKLGVDDEISSFTVPLCATIHMSGSAMKIVCCAVALCMAGGMPHDFGTFLHFIIVLSLCMVAAPGVPGGCIMAALAPLASILGFNAEQQALMIALYIAMDSFGTACNVTGDGAIALVVNRFFARRPSPESINTTNIK